MKNTKLRSDINKSLAKEAAKHGKGVSWFKYAKNTGNNAWLFLPHKEIQIEILKKLTKNISQKYPNFSSGQIADTITNIVNTKK